jgi:hypothetical protein
VSLAYKVIPFPGGKLHVVDGGGGKEWLMLDALTSALGLDLAQNVSRIMDAEEYSFAEYLESVSDDQGRSHRVFLVSPLTAIAWLLKLEVRSVPRGSRRDAIARYQREACEAVHNYFFRGVAVNPDAMPEDVRREVERQLRDHQIRKLELIRDLYQLTGMDPRDRILMQDYIRNQLLSASSGTALECGWPLSELIQQYHYPPLSRGQIISLGEFVSVGYQRATGHRAPKRPQFVDGARREVAHYVTADLPIIEPLIHDWCRLHGIRARLK